MKEWAWKDPQQGPLLRYEPGNWGDILKGEWLCHWLEWHQGDVIYQDPFCGWGEYPVTEATRRRVEASPARRYAAYLGKSSASLVEAHAGSLGYKVQAYLSDRESPWQPRQDCQLLLFDPYDFFERWPEWNDRLLEVSLRHDVVIYLYNKSPRGVGQFRNYQALRQHWKDRPLRVGRVAADSLLPRAWHEVWLAGPGASHAGLAERLARATLELHRHIADPGAWEC